MKTRITDIFGIQYPIILSGMSWISVPKMVAAVSEAGGLGILATGPLSADETRQAIREIRSLTKKPFAANASLMLPGATPNAEVLLEEKVPVINFALGKGDWIVKRAHEYGGKVMATVVNVRHAKRAQDYGADAVIVTGHEAAGHGGPVTSLVLIPTLADALDIPVIAAGGFADGRGLASALALGADAVAMGTRFMTTKESPLHDYYKNLSLEKTPYDTIYSSHFDGLPARVMDTPPAHKVLKRGLNIPGAFVNSRAIAKQLGLPFFKLFFGVMAAGLDKAIALGYMANAFNSIKKATENGDHEIGVLPVGQVIGLLNDIPTVAEVMERIVKEAKDVQKDLGKKLA
ncbi:MAG: nitronate monooxygenase [Deltaproteobacteria bacterium]|nr:nitronate monooxygenase [Candidatus Zymogenaceae bacterium]